MVTLTVRSIAALWLATALAAAPCRAQDEVASLAGAKLRITAPTVASEPIVGTLLESTDNEVILVVEGSRRTPIPRAAITRLERSQGLHRNAANGLAIGAALGAALFLVADVSDPYTGTAGEYAYFALIGACMGGLPGAGIGALVRTDRWAALPIENLRVTVAPLPRHGVGLRLAWTW